MIQPEDSLQHFGILGMKWGVRRYQNADGTLTEEGKSRYSSREKDVEYAKKYTQDEIQKDKKQLTFWENEVKKSEKMPATKAGIKKRINISDEDYEDYLREYKTPEKIKKSIIQNDKHEAKIYQNRISDWYKKYFSLNDVKIDAIMSDKQHQKQIDDIFSQAKGWLFRSIELSGLHSYMRDARQKASADKKKDQSSSKDTKSNKTLTQRFDDALKDNPKLTYDQIYKEMKVNLNSEDPDDYKDAEDRWLRKHGY